MHLRLGLGMGQAVRLRSPLRGLGTHKSTSDFGPMDSSNGMGQSINLSIYLPIYLSIYLSIYIYTYVYKKTHIPKIGQIMILYDSITSCIYCNSFGIVFSTQVGWINSKTPSFNLSLLTSKILYPKSFMSNGGTE